MQVHLSVNKCSIIYFKKFIKKMDSVFALSGQSLPTFPAEVNAAVLVFRSVFGTPGPP